MIRLFSGSALLLSLAAELALHLPPCPLCLLQRALHAALFFFSFGTARRICMFLLALSATVASYHTLVQWGALPDPCPRTLRIADETTFKQALLTQNTPCSRTTLNIGPIPAAALNAAASLILLCTQITRKRP